MYDTLDFIIQTTDNITLLLKEVAGLLIMPESSARKVDKAMFNWLRELTKSLRIWTDKGSLMTSGELILARVNIGAVVESWLKLFYCIYNDDYYNWVKENKKNNTEPNKLKFELLKQYGKEILYKKDDGWEEWIDIIQKRRNAIHSFNYKDIGTISDYYDDVEKLYDFILLIKNQLPPIDEQFDTYPMGYQKPYPDRERAAIMRV